MKIVNETILNQFRGPGRCLWCNRNGLVEPHHLIPKGMGSGRQLDIRINLAPLCRLCHTLVQGKTGAEAQLLQMVAARQLTTPEQIQKVCWHILRMPKETTDDELEEEGLLQWIIAGGSGNTNVHGGTDKLKIEIPF